MSLDEVAQAYADFAIAAVSVEPPAAVTSDAAATTNDNHPTRAAIIRAATELFAQKGYSGTTVRDLATRAGVQPSVLYYHFGSKETLLFEILGGTMRTLLDEVRQAHAASTGPRAQLAAVIRAHVRIDGSRKFAAIVSDAELDTLSDPHRAVIVALRRDYEALLASIIERGCAEHEFTSGSPKLAVYAIARMCSGAGRWGTPEAPDALRELGDRYAELVLAGLGHREKTSHPSQSRWEAMD